MSTTATVAAPATASAGEGGPAHSPSCRVILHQQCQTERHGEDGVAVSSMLPVAVRVELKSVLEDGVPVPRMEVWRGAYRLMKGGRSVWCDGNRLLLLCGSATAADGKSCADCPYYRIDHIYFRDDSNSLHVQYTDSKGGASAIALTVAPPLHPESVEPGAGSNSEVLSHFALGTPAAEWLDYCTLATTQFYEFWLSLPPAVGEGKKRKETRKSKDKAADAAATKLVDVLAPDAAPATGSAVSRETMAPRTGASGMPPRQVEPVSTGGEGDADDARSEASSGREGDDAYLAATRSRIACVIESMRKSSICPSAAAAFKRLTNPKGASRQLGLSRRAYRRWIISQLFGDGGLSQATVAALTAADAGPSDNQLSADNRARNVAACAAVAARSSAPEPAPAAPVAHQQRKRVWNIQQHGGSAQEFVPAAASAGLPPAISTAAEAQHYGASGPYAADGSPTATAQMYSPEHMDPAMAAAYTMFLYQQMQMSPHAMAAAAAAAAAASGSPTASGAGGAGGSGNPYHGYYGMPPSSSSGHAAMQAAMAMKAPQQQQQQPYVVFAPPYGAMPFNMYPHHMHPGAAALPPGMPPGMMPMMGMGHGGVMPGPQHGQAQQAPMPHGHYHYQ